MSVLRLKPSQRQAVHEVQGAAGSALMGSPGSRDLLLLHPVNTTQHRFFFLRCTRFYCLCFSFSPSLLCHLPQRRALAAEEQLSRIKVHCGFHFSRDFRLVSTSASATSTASAQHAVQYTHCSNRSAPASASVSTPYFAICLRVMRLLRGSSMVK